MTGGRTGNRIGFAEEVRLVPAAGWVVAALVMLATIGVGIPLVLAQLSGKPGEPPGWALGPILFVAACVLAIWVLLIAYVNADAGRRGMSRTLWTLLVLFVPNAIGFIIYFLVRHPITIRCATCGGSLESGFAFCPACGKELSPRCPSCGRAVAGGWTVCAYCGARLS